MTGFGRSAAEISEIGLQITVEISSVNRKSLDVFIRRVNKLSEYGIKVKSMRNEQNRLEELF